MKIPIEYKIISENPVWESERKYWEIDVSFVEYCVHKWLLKRKVFLPNTIARILFNREFKICNDRLEANKAELYAEMGKICDMSGNTFIDWYFYEPNRKYTNNEEPFICIYRPEVERMLREALKCEEEE